MASNHDGQIAAKIAEALTAGEINAQAATTTEALAGDPKKIFCDNWDTVKTVLLILRQFAPAVVKPLIDIVIKAGDTLKGLICN